MSIKINTLIEHIPVKILQQAAAELSGRYRLQQKPFMTRREHYLAYLVTRMPATQAAIMQVLRRVKNFEIDSMLDLGAGPGTSFFATQQVFSKLSQITLLETDPQFIALGKEIIEQPVTWLQAELPCPLTLHDLVLMSYSLNEIENLEVVLEQAFAAARKLLVIIEPGTPQGYARIIKARQFLLSKRAQMIAPCPNALPCPMQGNDWCHFPARVERSKIHKQLKNADMGFEDEKFSYLIVGKEPVTLPQARIIAKPKIHKGWLEFSLCTQGRIEKKIYSQRDKEFYKKARKLDWGDEI